MLGRNATKAGFRDWSGALGVKGALSAGGGAVTLAPGETATTVIHWTDRPGARRRVWEATATLVTLRAPSLKHTWRPRHGAQVCTTSDYAPDSQPLTS